MNPGKKSILVVEDEDNVRLTIRDYLLECGYKVHVSSDGVGAIKQLVDNDIDVIISDYRMEVLGGDYWIKFLAKYCSEKHILITSGFLRPSFAIPFDVLYKPFDYSELDKYIKSLPPTAERAGPSGA